MLWVLIRSTIINDTKAMALLMSNHNICFNGEFRKNISLDIPLA